MGELLAVKRLLLAFWSAWLTLVLLTNLIDGLTGWGIVRGRAKFASGNWETMKQVCAVYGTPAWLVAGLFAGVVVWDGAAAALMWRALRLFDGDNAAGLAAVHTAFLAAIGLFAALVIADEIFIAHALMTKHLVVLVLLLLSLLSLRLLPDDRRGAESLRRGRTAVERGGAMAGPGDALCTWRRHDPAKREAFRRRHVEGLSGCRAQLAEGGRWASRARASWSTRA
jgi:hypothetical protein